MFKALVAVAALRGEKMLAEKAEQRGVHPDHVTDWKGQLLERSSEAFGEKADGTSTPNIEKMEVKMCRITLKNDFLESALIKAGLLSAKKMTTRKYNHP
jgi:transposase-like protein